MAIFKCKMCGGDLEVSDGVSVIECDYCGTKQTVASTDSEKKINLFNRANRLRMASEFDKAAAIYEQIIAEFPEEAEAYWCLSLCNYGIEYVDDPATAEKIPTCHRASFEKLRKTENYELAVEYADMTARIVYQDQAKEIDRIMGEILSVSQNEEPYDIFICYKETDFSGARTPDSVLAQDIYDALTAKDYKVFFSRITLEDKLGQHYEPYIFAALQSAKVMLAVGTDYEYYNAVWVKNEWSRFLRLMAKDKSKMLIPCFKDMDAYDMPDEFKGLQAQDMGKLGFVQDLVRGIDKIFGRTERPAPVQTANNPTVDSLLQRTKMFIEDKAWADAKAYAEKVLDIVPTNAEAYLCRLLSSCKAGSIEELFGTAPAPWANKPAGARTLKEITDSPDFQKIGRFGTPGLKRQLSDALTAAKEKEFDKLCRLIEASDDGEEIKRYLSYFPLYSDITGANDNKDSYLNKANTIIARKTAEAEEKARRIKAEAEEKARREKAEAEKRARQIKEEQAKREKQGVIALFKDKLLRALIELNYYQIPINEKYRAEIKRDMSDLQAVLNKIETELPALSNQISAYRLQLNSLGLFSGSKKSVLTEKIAEASEKLEILTTKKKVYSGFCYEIAELLNKYADIDINEIVSECDNCSAKEMFAIRKRCGMNSVFFGKYPQKNSGIKEPVEWLILKHEDNKVLLLSKYALDCRKYDNAVTALGAATWYDCSLRKWLNGEFLNTAFSEEEQKLIVLSKINADNSLKYPDSHPGLGSKDKIFIFSQQDYLKYDHDNKLHLCAMTDYALSRGAYAGKYKTADGENTCLLWLRQPGKSWNSVAYIWYDGKYNLEGQNQNYAHCAVRPAMWITLD